MKNLPKIGELVVVNDLPDATLYKVVEVIGKFGVGLVDSEMEKKGYSLAVNYIDVNCLQKPTRQQLENNC